MRLSLLTLDCLWPSRLPFRGHCPQSSGRVRRGTHLLPSCPADPREALRNQLGHVLDPKQDVLVHSGCCNKHAIIQGLINKRHLFLPVLKAANQRSGCHQQGQFWGRPSAGSRRAPTHCKLIRGRGRGPFNQGTDSILEAPSLSHPEGLTS